MFNEEIMKKVEQKEKRDNYFKRCLKAGICPRCGDNLSSESFNDGGKIYRCSSPSCGSVYAV